VSTRPFRFGVNIIPSGSKEDLQTRCRQAEDLGYDIVTVSDQVTLELPFAGVTAWSTLPPFIALAAAAEVTSLRLGTYTLNASLYRPALLVRDINALQLFTGNRLELGVGAGYMKADFAAAEVPWGSAGERIGRLERLVTSVRELTRDPAPPMLIGNAISERVLKISAENADIVSLLGAEGRTAFTPARLLDSARLTEQCDFIKATAGDRFAGMELNTLVHGVNITDDRDTVPDFPNIANLTAEELHKVPAVLNGSVDAIAEDLHRHRETYGISYFTVRVPNMADFAKVISQLR
jgi:probable F420-dependent oxidoreductase